MKPTFALDLRHDSITLLHRAGSHWRAIGATAFGAPDMDAALAQMRATALELSPQGIATKLIIPNDQILYTSVIAPGPGRDARRAQIRDALIGRTPYTVEELAYDWAEPVPDGADEIIVAVIARETLQEAEDFVAAQGLNPVGFAAVPDDPSFGREPWFGASSIAATILGAGVKVEGDSAPLLLSTQGPVAKPEPEVVTAPEPMPVPAPEPVAEAEPAVDLTFLTEPSAYAEEAAFPASETLARVHDEDAAPPEWQELPQVPLVEVAAKAEFTPEPELPAKPEPTEELPVWLTKAATATSPRTADTSAAEFLAPVRDPAGTTRRWHDDIDEAPMAEDVAGDDPIEDLAAAVPEKPHSPGGSVTQTELAVDDALSPALGAPMLEEFASRRSAAPTLSGVQRPAVPVSPAPQPVATQPVETQLVVTRAQPPQAPSPKAAKGLRALVTAPGIAGFRSKSKSAEPKRPELKKPDQKRIVTIQPDPRAAAARATKPGEARSAETGFVAGRIGQRQKGRPAYLLLVLTVALLVAMALIAAWSSYLALREGEPGTGTAIVSAPQAVSPVAEPTVTTPPEPTSDQAATPDTAPAALPEPTVITTETDLAPEGGPSMGAATGAAPGDILLSGQDPAPVLPDPVAQPTITALAAGPPPRPDTPPPFGSVLEFDATGLIKPTPEGIETPEGVFLRAGRPPVVPPRRSAVAEAAALAASPLVRAVLAEPAAAVAPADPALATARPKARPKTLRPPGPDQTGLAPADGQPVQTVLRPKTRPATVLAAGEAARQTAAPATPEPTTPGPTTPGAEASLASGAVAEGGLIAAPSVVRISSSTVTISRVPAPRPRNFDRAVEAAVAAALQPSAPPEPQPEAAPAEPPPEAPKTKGGNKAAVGKPDDHDEVDEPEVASAAPSSTSRGAVAKNATFRNAIDLGETNLIGIYGSENRRYAMVRTGAGGYKKVKVGDRVDGGKVAAITTKELRLQKGGQMRVLKIPGG
jgi:hypothetical protein